MIVSRKRKGGSEIPTSSMSDIAFLLIIFFMATTKFDVKEGLSMVLPPAAQEGAEVVKLSDKDMTRILIMSSGEIMLNNDNIGIFNQPVFDGKVREIISANPDMIFSLKTDREAKYNEMIKVLDRLKTAGVEKISLSTN
ncbi:MAG: biopolymer transporter ExbD [Candidatus Cloacimonadaceae bacterium]